MLPMHRGLCHVHDHGQTFVLTDAIKNRVKVNDTLASQNALQLVRYLKPVFHLATFFARREAETRIRQRDWLTLASEKIRREQVGTIPTFFSVRGNTFAKWKTGLRSTFLSYCLHCQNRKSLKTGCKNVVGQTLDLVVNNIKLFNIVTPNVVGAMTVPGCQRYRTNNVEPE